MATQLNSGLAFVCAGASLWALQRRVRTVAAVAGSAAALIGTLTTFEHLAGVSLGIDTAFIPVGFVVDGANGRMGLNVSCCLVLLGVALAAAAGPSSARRDAFVGVVASMVLAIGVLALVGHGFGVPGAFAWGRFSEMAIPTAFGLALVSAGLLQLLLGERRDSRAIPSWYPIAWALATAAVGMGLWRALLIQSAADQQARVEALARSLAAQWRASVLSMAQVTLHWGHEWEERAPSGLDWATATDRLFATAPQVTAIAWLGLGDQEKLERHLPGTTPIDVRGVATAIRARIASGRPITAFDPLAQDGNDAGPERSSLVFVVPCVQDRQSAAYVAAAFDPLALARALAEPFAPFEVAFVADGVDAVHRSVTSVRRTLPSAAVHIELGDRRWTLRIVDSADHGSPLAWILLTTGLGLSVTIGRIQHLRKAALARSQQFESIVAQAPLGMLLVAANGTIYQANHACHEMFGYDECALVGADVEALLPADRRERHIDRRSEYTRAPRTRAMGEANELAGLRKDGSTFGIDVALGPVELAAGRFTLAVVWDVEARRRAERELASRTEELVRSNRDLEQFAYVASHDLRAPLRAIDQLTSWLVADLGAHAGDDSKRHFDLLRGRVRRMDALLTALLEYARASKTRNELHLVDVAVLLRDVSSLLEWPPGFRLEAPGPFPVLRTDRTGLHQVFQNLIGNAIKHHDGTSGVITVAWRDTPAAHEFRVSDDGPGIPSEYHSRIFAMFETLRPRDEVEGSGMGLALVRRLVELRGGTIEVEPAAPRGVTFRFTWPKEIPGTEAR